MIQSPIHSRRNRLAGVTSSLLAMLLVSFCAFSSASAQDKKPAPKVKPLAEPDLTKGEKMIRRGWYESRHLGVTGATGNFFGYRRMGTSLSRSIQVTAVLKGSPADGKLQKGDVVLGVNDQKFTSDAARLFADALAEGEKSGKLELSVWRPSTEPGQGKTMPVSLTLPVVEASYSKTAPWNCARTDMIVKKAADAIVSRGIERGTGGIFEALGLLATKDQTYLPVLEAYAQKLIADFPQQPAKMAHKLTFLAEYYDVSKDKKVFPFVEAYAARLSTTQTYVGTWAKENHENLACGLSLALAKKVGVEFPALDRALGRFSAYLRWYMDKGGVAMHTTEPRKSASTDGSTALAAVVFDLMGDKVAAEHFTKLTISTIGIRSFRDNGRFYHWIWGILGAARGGDEAVKLAFDTHRWSQDMERRADDTFGAMKADTFIKYPDNKKWSATGLALLTYCLPRKATFITGKGKSTIAPITGKELQSVAMTGMYPARGSSVEELLKALGHWSPMVRARAAGLLNVSEEKEAFQAKLIEMLKGNDRFARYGACMALDMTSKENRQILADISRETKDATMRYYAMNMSKPVGRKGGSPEGKQAMLELLADKDSNLDPYSRDHSQIAHYLFNKHRHMKPFGYYREGRGAEKIDRELLIRIINTMLTSPTENTVSMGAEVTRRVLNEKDMESVWNNIYRGVKTKAPLGLLTPCQNACLGILTKYHTKEGLALSLKLFDETMGTWKVVGALSCLRAYGKHLEEHLPRFEEAVQLLYKIDPANHHMINHVGKDWMPWLKEFKEKPAPKKLISIGKFINEREVGPTGFTLPR